MSNNKKWKSRALAGWIILVLLGVGFGYVGSYYPQYFGVKWEFGVRPPFITVSQIVLVVSTFAAAGVILYLGFLGKFEKWLMGNRT